MNKILAKVIIRLRHCTSVVGILNINDIILLVVLGVIYSM